MPELQTTDGVRLHYDEDGPPSAPPVVLLHGLGSDGRADQPLVDAIGERLRVVRLDLRGHGQSEPLSDPNRYGWFGRAADDVTELLDALGLEVVALQGGSLGAAVAIATALAHPERVRTLGLSSPAIGAGDALGNPVAAGFMDGVAQMGLLGLLDSLTSSGLLTLPPDDLAEARQNYARQDDASMRACVAALARACLVEDLDELRSVRCPTMLVARRGDVLHPFDLAEAIAGRIAGACLVEDDGAVPLRVRVRDAADRIAAFHSAVESPA